MPVGADPNATFKVVLKCDQNLPKEEQPWFEFRYMSASKMRQQMNELRDRLMGEAEERTETEEETEKLWEKGVYFQYVKLGLVRWGNLKDPATGELVPFDIDKLDDYLTVAEIRELRDAFIEQGFGRDERKNFK
ncbi:MAG: hypothetical protein ABII09_03565 [Planctomycetota bacterium]